MTHKCFLTRRKRFGMLLRKPTIKPKILLDYMIMKNRTMNEYAKPALVRMDNWTNKDVPMMQPFSRSILSKTVYDFLVGLKKSLMLDFPTMKTLAMVVDHRKPWPANTPLDPSLKLSSAKENVAVGNEMLIYLSSHGQDIAYAVSLVSQFKHNPKKIHLQVAYKILQYLEGTPGREVIFKRNRNVKSKPYMDVNYSGSIVDRRLTTVQSIAPFLEETL
ncbi:hypothetical protein CR513_63039, partial [Mucuna pruriens]